MVDECLTFPIAVISRSADDRVCSVYRDGFAEVKSIIRGVWQGEVGLLYPVRLCLFVQVDLSVIGVASWSSDNREIATNCHLRAEQVMVFCVASRRRF